MKLNLSKRLSVLIFISVLSIFVVTTAYNSNTYSKSEDDAYFSPIGSHFIFPDGSKLLRFYRPLNDGHCNEPNLHLKVLHSNGTLSPFNVQNFSVPAINFCRSSKSKTSPDYIQIT